MKILQYLSLIKFCVPPERVVLCISIIFLIVVLHNSQETYVV